MSKVKIIGKDTGYSKAVPGGRVVYRLGQVFETDEHNANDLCKRYPDQYELVTEPAKTPIMAGGK